MIKLIHNELLKITYSRKIPLIIGLLIVFISLFAYGENYTYNLSIQRIASVTGDESFSWEALAEQEIDDLEQRMNSSYRSEESKEAYAVEISQLEYFLERGINPITPGAAKFSTNFAEQGLYLLFPLLIIILGADMVSGEFSGRTIKVLMTRAVPRWQILLSKILSLWIMTTIVVTLAALLSLFISGLVFGRWGFDEPVLTGLSFVGGSVDTGSIVQLSRISYVVLTYSLVWFVSLVIASVTFMVSVLVKSTPAAIGIIMAALIGGQFLQFFLDEWALVKYFFVTNLNLTQYLTGDYTPVQGLSMGFSITVLSAWALLSLVTAFAVFNRRDILV